MIFLFVPVRTWPGFFPWIRPAAISEFPPYMVKLALMLADGGVGVVAVAPLPVGPLGTQ